MARSTGAKVTDAPTHVALLRGINVGGKHIIPMTDLVRMFEEAGARGVRTYIQSGNVVFSATPAAAKRLAGRVEEAIRNERGFEARVITRTREELARVARKNPLMTPACDPKRHHVGFLATAPEAARVAALDPRRSPGDRFLVNGDVLYVHYGESVRDSKLTGAYFDSVLGTPSTFRNWRTVLKLAEMREWGRGSGVRGRVASASGGGIEYERELRWGGRRGGRRGGGGLHPSAHRETANALRTYQRAPVAEEVRRRVDERIRVRDEPGQAL